MDEQRVFIGDVKPYMVPECLDDLQGPASGVITLPNRIYWQPGSRDFDVSVPIRCQMAYQPILAEGTLEDIHHWINKDLLILYWDAIFMPRRLRMMWEDKFPELRGRNRRG